MYLGMEGKKANKLIDGAVIYGTPWSYIKGHDFFMTNMNGLPQKFIGMNFNDNIKKN